MMRNDIIKLVGFCEFKHVLSKRDRYLASDNFFPPSGCSKVKRLFKKEKKNDYFKTLIEFFVHNVKNCEAIIIGPIYHLQEK